MPQNGQKWPKVAQIWPQMAQNGPRMTQNDPKWPKNGPQLPQMPQKLGPDLRTFSKSFVSQSLSLSSALWAQTLAHKTLARLTTPWQRGNTLCYSGRHIDRNSSNLYKVRDQDNLVWSVFKLIICKWFCKFMLTVAYMSPLCPCVNSILHDRPVLDTRMVFEAAFDHSWKD